MEKYKIGDRVEIIDGSWSVKLNLKPYNTQGIHGIDKIQGTICAINCRLPLGPNTGKKENVSPIKGISLTSTVDILFNNLLVQTDNGYVCTMTRHVKLVPQKYKLVLCGVEISITKEQYENLCAAEYFSNCVERE